MPKRPEPDELLKIFREVADELAAEGRPLPIPPDTDDDELDRVFWERVDERLKTVRPLGTNE